MLRRRSAETIELPGIEPGPPTSLAGTDAALAELEKFSWIVFVGSESVARFLEREPGTQDRIRARLVALGAGTRKSLTARGLDVTLAPTEHVGAKVSAALGEVAGMDILLVRREGTSRDLPDILTERGARVMEADGYAMQIRTTPEDREAIMKAPLDCVALGNPTAARFFAGALPGWNLPPETFERSLVAAAGAVTAREARGAGLTVGLASEGRMINFAKAIEAALTK
jgi:uroporphyrinogen III methyltransferase / synthase